MLVLFISSFIAGMLLVILYHLVFDDDSKKRLAKLQANIADLLEKYDVEYYDGFLGDYNWKKEKDKKD